MEKGIIVDNIEKSINEEIGLLEEEKQGISFMLGTLEDWDNWTRSQYLIQIFNIEEKIRELKISLEQSSK